MQPIFDQPKHFGFQLADSLTSGYKGLLLSGAEVRTAAGESGTLFFQGIVQPEFQIHFQVYDLIKPERIPTRQGNHFLWHFSR